MRTLSALLAGFLIVGTVHARTIHDVDVPEQYSVDGKTLQLNGAGIRTATVLQVKVYVAAFYAPAPLRSLDDVLASKGPLYLNLTYVRAFEKKRVHDAWKWQFEQSGVHSYPDMEKDKQSLLDAFGEIKKGGTEAFEIVGDETRVYEDGVLKTTIKGRDFQVALLSLWLGEKPVMPKLKAALLSPGDAR